MVSGSVVTQSYRADQTSETGPFDCDHFFLPQSLCNSGLTPRLMSSSFAPSLGADSGFWRQQTGFSFGEPSALAGLHCISSLGHSQPQASPGALAGGGSERSPVSSGFRRSSPAGSSFGGGGPPRSSVLPSGTDGRMPGAGGSGQSQRSSGFGQFGGQSPYHGSPSSLHHPWLRNEWSDLSALVPRSSPRSSASSQYGAPGSGFGIPCCSLTSLLISGKGLP